MKLIPLTQGMFSQVDNSDYHWLNQWKWCAVNGGKTYYAMRIETHPKRKVILMHRLILNTPENMKGDHKDHNGLNNQRENIRNCNNSQNGMNKTAWGKSKYLGVTIKNGRGDKIRIIAQIRKDGKQKHLGDFKTEEQAARKYDEVAKIMFGEFANLNFK